jgi:hypothetical protein
MHFPLTYEDGIVYIIETRILSGSPYYRRLKPIGTMNTMKTMMAVAALALAIGNVQAHGSGWVIQQTAKDLGIIKDVMELTPADIDQLTDKQADGLAHVEREMWGQPGFTLGAIASTTNSRDYLKQASAIYANMLAKEKAAYAVNKAAPAAKAEAAHHEMDVPAAPTDAIKVVKYSWEFDALGMVAIMHVTLKNISNVTVGNIKYESHYYAETGKSADYPFGAGGVKEIEKMLKPGQTRTFDLNDGFIVKSDADRATFAVVSYEVIAN